MDPKDIKIDQYDYPLPDGRIARRPLAERDGCRLLVWRGGEIGDAIFRELPGMLGADSVLVYNNTRVINARLRFKKDTGAAIEIFCLEPAEPADYAENFASTARCRWTCFVGNSKKWKEGPLKLYLADGTRLTACRVAPQGNAWLIEFSWTGGKSFSEIIQEAGEIPVPPYLNRATEEGDSTDYQTVYSHIEGSVAAPTAGLHFTPGLLDCLREKGVEQIEVTLHVGAGTFQPVKSDAIGGHPMHSEFIAVGLNELKSIETALNAGKRIIAVGTTSVRTLESLYHAGCLIGDGKWTGEVAQWYPYEKDHPGLTPSEALHNVTAYTEKHGLPAFIADTRIIIAPGYSYKIVKGMVTNFHQPRSTLLLLVSAFLGGEHWREIYNHALSGDYRFLSYGDACLLL